MTTRTSNLVIGSTTLVVVAAALVGFLGLQKVRMVQQRGPLRIVFEGSASGLAKGGSVNFDGVQVGEVVSLKLDNPRKVVALVMVENTAPIRKDTVVGLEFQGLTGMAAVSLTGGAAAAAPVPLDEDGIPTLNADLTETQSIRDTLHNVDRILVGNQAVMKEALQNFQNYTATLATKGDEIDRMIGKADSAFGNFDRGIAKIDDLVPGLTDGKDGELYQQLHSIRELAESLNKRSANLMEEGRRSLLDISEAAHRMDQKFEPQGGGGTASPRPGPRRQ